MTIVTQAYDYVIGADYPRAHPHGVHRRGRHRRSPWYPHFPDLDRGAGSLWWVAQENTAGQVLAAVEGTRSYGARLTRVLEACGIEVSEVKPPRSRTRSARGKSDEIDALAAIHTVLAQPVEQLAIPRREGAREAMRVLLSLSA